MDFYKDGPSSMNPGDYDPDGEFQADILAEGQWLSEGEPYVCDMTISHLQAAIKWLEESNMTYKEEFLELLGKELESRNKDLFKDF